jgi:hypothetical protein
MARHFAGLYLLIVITLAAVSWGQDELLRIYSNQDPAEEKGAAIAMTALQSQLGSIPTTEWKRRVKAMSAETGLDMELFVTDSRGR